MGLLSKIKNKIIKNKVDEKIYKELDKINTIEDLGKFMDKFYLPKENMFFETPIIQAGAADKEKEYVEIRQNPETYRTISKNEILEMYTNEEGRTDWDAIKAHFTDEDGNFDKAGFDEVSNNDAQIFIERMEIMTSRLEASFHDYWVCRAKAMYDTAKEEFTPQALAKYDKFFKDRLLNNDNRDDSLLLTGVTLGLFAPVYLYLSGYRKMLEFIDEEKYYSKRYEKDYRYEKREYDLKGEQFLKDNSYFARLEVLLPEIISSEFTEEEKRRIYDYARYTTDVIIKNKLISFKLVLDDHFYDNGKINALIFTEEHKNYIVKKCVKYVDEITGISVNNWTSSATTVSERDGVIKGTCVTTYELWSGLIRATSCLLEQVRAFGKLFAEIDTNWYYIDAKKNYATELAYLNDFEVKAGKFNNIETYFEPAYQLMEVTFEQYLTKYGSEIVDEGSKGLANAWFAHYGYESMHVSKEALSFKRNADVRELLDKQNMWC